MIHLYLGFTLAGQADAAKQDEARRISNLLPGDQARHAATVSRRCGGQRFDVGPDELTVGVARTRAGR